MKAHRERKANVAAKRPVVETWKERQERTQRERQRRVAAKNPFGAAMAMSLGGSGALLDALFKETDWPPKRDGAR
jgi:hypothetical protein